MICNPPTQIKCPLPWMYCIGVLYEYFQLKQLNNGFKTVASQVVISLDNAIFVFFLCKIRVFKCKKRWKKGRLMLGHIEAVIFLHPQKKSWKIMVNCILFFPQMVFISILIMNAICPFTLIGEYKPTMNKTYWPIPPLIRSVWCVSQAVILRRQKVILYVGFGRVIFSVLPTFSYCFITWTYS